MENMETISIHRWSISSFTEAEQVCIAASLISQIFVMQRQIVFKGEENQEVASNFFPVQ